MLIRKIYDAAFISQPQLSELEGNGNGRDYMSLGNKLMNSFVFFSLDFEFLQTINSNLESVFE